MGKGKDRGADAGGGADAEVECEEVLILGLLCPGGKGARPSAATEGGCVCGGGSSQETDGMKHSSRRVGE